MANNFDQVEKTLGEQMADLLRRKPKNFDVVFSVGPDKIKVEAVKFILKAASPVFEQKFDENSENGLVNEISLPNIDPMVFQLFVNLLILDAWSVESVKSLKLSPNNLLNLLGLCRRYEITKAIRNLEEAAIAQSFDTCNEPAELLEITRDNLKTLFSFENHCLDETDIFDLACWWAGKRCSIERLEPTGENYRKVLGASLFEIRFPTITDFDNSPLQFKTNRRAAAKLNRSNTQEAQPQAQMTMNLVEVKTSSLSGCSVLSLPPQDKLMTSGPSTVYSYCSILYELSFQVEQKISLYGFGFLGPIDEDADFDVTVHVMRCNNGFSTFDSGTFQKQIFARKGKTFYFVLDEPIAVESDIGYDRSWENCCTIYFCLK